MKIKRILYFSFLFFFIFSITFLVLYIRNTEKDKQTNIIDEKDSDSKEANTLKQKKPLPSITSSINPLKPFTIEELKKGQRIRISGVIKKEPYLSKNNLYLVDILFKNSNAEKTLTVILGQKDWHISTTIRKDWSNNNEKLFFEGKPITKTLDTIKKDKNIAFFIDTDKILEFQGECSWCQEFNKLYNNNISINKSFAQQAESNNLKEFKDVLGPVVQMEISQ